MNVCKCVFVVFQNSCDISIPYVNNLYCSFKVYDACEYEFDMYLFVILLCCVGPAS